MGKRRRNIKSPQRERIKELLKAKEPKEIYKLLHGTKDQISLSSIYNIQRELKRKETGPEKPLVSPYKGEFDTTYPNVDAILLTPELDRQQKIWVLFNWPSLGLEKGKIAERVGGSLADIQRAIEETKKELTGKTKEGTKMEQSQSMLNLPPWVNQAQREHLEGREQQDEREGISIVTYPGGIAIRQQLELFKDCFPDIYPGSYSLYHPLDDENVMAQLRGHLPDEAFWSRVKDFGEKAKKCDALRDAACERFTSGEELTSIEPSRGPEPDEYITSGWRTGS